MLQSRATAILADERAPTAGLLNAKRMLEIMETPLENSGFGPNRRRVEMVISLDDWLRRYPTRLVLD